jgi:hypothetical protein
LKIGGPVNRVYDPLEALFTVAVRGVVRSFSEEAMFRMLAGDAGTDDVANGQIRGGDQLIVKSHPGIPPAVILEGDFSCLLDERFSEVEKAQNPTVSFPAHRPSSVIISCD